MNYTRGFDNGWGRYLISPTGQNVVPQILYCPEKHDKISYPGLRSSFDALLSMKGKSHKERKKVQRAPRARILRSFP